MVNPETKVKAECDGTYDQYRLEVTKSNLNCQPDNSSTYFISRKIMTEQLTNYLEQFREEEIIYIPNPGNAGDSVIAVATYQIFDKVGLNYVTPRFSQCDFKNRIVIYGGGGNLVGPNTFSARVVGAAQSCAKKLVILPHTIKSVDSLLSNCGNNVDIICREAMSYEYVSQIAQTSNVYLMDDVALSLNINEAHQGRPIVSLPKRASSYLFNKLLTDRGVPALRNVIASSHISTIRARLTEQCRSEELFCFRGDGEKTSIPIPPSNLDLSVIFQLGVETKDIAYLAARELLMFLANYKVVHTNRLHIAISSALLGLEVRFYSNNYYKCRAVYDFSIRDRFTNVKWVD